MLKKKTQQAKVVINFEIDVMEMAIFTSAAFRRWGMGVDKEKAPQRFAEVLSEPLVGFEPTTPRLQITCSGQLS